MTAEMQVLGEILRGAGDLLSEAVPTRIVQKARQDYVTDVDTRLDAYLTYRLGDLMPGVAVLSEERKVEAAVDAFWLIDPLDGTHNLLAGVPFYGCCVALFDTRGVVMAAVLDHAQNTVFVAQRGQGAFRNSDRMRLPDIASELVALSSGALDAVMVQADVYQGVRRLGKLRNLGSQALHLSYVASGRLGGAVSQEACLWDDAAARLIAEEAGAHYRSFAASDKDPCALVRSKQPLHSLCAHPRLFSQLEPLFERIW